MYKNSKKARLVDLLSTIVRGEGEWRLIASTSGLKESTICFDGTDELRAREVLSAAEGSGRHSISGLRKTLMDRFPERLDLLQSFLDFERVQSTTSKAPPSSALRINLPQPSAWFGGRQAEIAQLKKALRPEEQPTVTRTIALHGYGGIGKTQIALAFAWKHLSEYDYILWIDASDEHSLTKSCRSIANRLNLVDGEENHHAVCNLLQDWFSQVPNWIAIFDNADHPELIRDWWPASPLGQVILTSRHSEFQILGGLRKIHIRKWSLPTTVSWLLMRTSRSSLSSEELHAAHELSELLDGLPLATSQAASYIEKREVSFSNYLEEFRLRSVSTLEKSIPDARYEGTVATTWKLGMRFIRESYPHCALILTICAFLESDDIPESIFVRAAPLLGPAAVQLVEVEGKLAGAELLAPLANLSLIERSPTQNAFTIHRLVQQVLRMEMSESECIRYIILASQVLSHALSEHIGSSGDVDFVDRIIPHAVKFLDWHRKFKVVDSSASTLLTLAALRLSDQADYITALICFKYALDVDQELLGAAHPNIAIRYANLATAHYALGDLKNAKHYYHQALYIDTKHFGDNDFRLAFWLNRLGVIYTDLGDLDTAEIQLSRAIEISHQYIETTPRWSARAFNNYGLLMKERGRLDIAWSFFRRAFDIYTSIHGLSHPATATVINNMGSIMHDRGEPDRAAVCYSLAANIDIEYFGWEHPRVAVRLNNLAAACKSMDEVELASKLFFVARESLAIRLGVRHPTTRIVERGLTSLQKYPLEIEDM